MHRSSSLLVLIIFLYLRLETTKCRNVEETLIEVNELLSANVKSLQRRSRDHVEVNPIWQEYEFGTNAGNREGNSY